MDNNKLQHWGIKGMKWGRRRWQNKDGSLTNAGKIRYVRVHDDAEDANGRDDDAQPFPSRPKVHDDYAKTHSGKHVSEMSTKELQEWSNRRNLENQYREANMTKGAKFKRWMAKAATDVAGEVAKDYAKKALKAGVNVGLEKWAGSTKDPKTANFLSKMLNLNKDDTASMIKNAASRAADKNVKKNRDTRDEREKNENPDDQPTTNTSNSDNSGPAPKNTPKPKKDKNKKRDDLDTHDEREKNEKPDDKTDSASKSKVGNGQSDKAEKNTGEVIDVTSAASKSQSSTSTKKTYSSPTYEVVPPREKNSGPLNSSQISMIKALRASGEITVSDIAKAVGAAPSTVSKYTAGSAKQAAVRYPKKKEEKD